MIVWSYYINDIENAAANHGRKTHPDLCIKSPWVRFLIENSHFLNFVYWRLFRGFSRLAGGPKWESIDADFEDAAIWRTPHLELQAVIEYARDRRIGLLAVIFPRLTDVGGSRNATGKVGTYSGLGERL